MEEQKEGQAVQSYFSEIEKETPTEGWIAASGGDELWRLVPIKNADALGDTLVAIIDGEEVEMPRDTVHLLDPTHLRNLEVWLRYERKLSSLFSFFFCLCFCSLSLFFILLHLLTRIFRT